jgi:hypothetical protein
VFLICLAIYSPTFPNTCLSPDQPGYGQVVSDGTRRRRARRNTQPVAPIVRGAALENRPSCTVVTGAPGGISAGTLYPLYHTPQMHPPPVPHSHSHPPPPTWWRPELVHSPSMSSLQTTAAINSPTLREDHCARSSPYPGTSLLSMRALSPHPVGIPETITFPPIQSGSQSRSFTQPPYALPPISALEGGHPDNAAEVLRRLKRDNESTLDDGWHNEEQRARAHSMSTYK